VPAPPREPQPAEASAGDDRVGESRAGGSVA
jgi:hypothetical protein